jgi:biotin transport system substrate-specific component
VSKEKVSPINEFLWAFIGLLLTVFGTFVEAFLVFPTGKGEAPLLTSHSLGVTYQLAGVLLTGCLGGKNAAALAQIAYLVLGLFKLPVFGQGGGFNYLQQPSFGYILGFIPGAWLCGLLAFQGKRRLESLAFSAACGLIIIHLCGIIYLIALTYISPFFGNTFAPEYLPRAISIYSFNPFPSQLVIVCVVAVVAFIIRLILFY